MLIDLLNERTGEEDSLTVGNLQLVMMLATSQTHRTIISESRTGSVDGNVSGRHTSSDGEKKKASKRNEKKVGSGSRYKREVQGNYGFRSSLSVEVITTRNIFKLCLEYLFISSRTKLIHQKR